jgi:GT2 family glycosyltransferase
MISIVIPTYTNFSGLKACIASIEEYTNLDDIEIIVSANGAPKEVKPYPFNDVTKVIWHDAPIGYAKACNAGIKEAKGEYIILLNDDCVLTPQPQNRWLNMLLRPFQENSKVGLSGPLINFSPPANSRFIVFFIVMIKREVFDKIGLLSEDYGMGAGEDTQFCIEAMQAGYELGCASIGPVIKGEKYMTGNFPIFHAGEETVSKLKNWQEIFNNNSKILARKYNPNWSGLK